MGIEGIHGVEPRRAELAPPSDYLGMSRRRPDGQRGPEPNRPLGQVSKKGPPALQLPAENSGQAVDVFSAVHELVPIEGSATLVPPRIRGAREADPYIPAIRAAKRLVKGTAR